MGMFDQPSGMLSGGTLGPLARLLQQTAQSARGGALAQQPNGYDWETRPKPAPSMEELDHWNGAGRYRLLSYGDMGDKDALSWFLNMAPDYSKGDVVLQPEGTYGNSHMPPSPGIWGSINATPDLTYPQSPWDRPTWNATQGWHSGNNEPVSDGSPAAGAATGHNGFLSPSERGFISAPGNNYGTPLSVIEILRKYGILGPIAAPGALMPFMGD